MVVHCSSTTGPLKREACKTKHYKVERANTHSCIGCTKWWSTDHVGMVMEATILCKEGGTWTGAKQKTDPKKGFKKKSQAICMHLF